MWLRRRQHTHASVVITRTPMEEEAARIAAAEERRAAYAAATLDQRVRAGIEISKLFADKNRDLSHWELGFADQVGQRHFRFVNTRTGTVVTWMQLYGDRGPISVEATSSDRDVYASARSRPWSDNPQDVRLPWVERGYEGARNLALKIIAARKALADGEKVVRINDALQRDLVS